MGKRPDRLGDAHRWRIAGALAATLMIALLVAAYSKPIGRGVVASQPDIQPLKVLAAAPPARVALPLVPLQTNNASPLTSRVLAAARWPDGQIRGLTLLRGDDSVACGEIAPTAGGPYKQFVWLGDSSAVVMPDDPNYATYVVVCATAGQQKPAGSM